MFDNCPTVWNFGQGDIDSDTQGDACDADIDGDRLANAADNCADVYNPDQRDDDRDGRGLLCDGDDRPAGSGPAPTPPPDRSKPTLRLAGLRGYERADLAIGLPVGLRASEACSITGRLSAGKRTLARGRAALAGAGRTFVFLRANAKTMRWLARRPRGRHPEPPRRRRLRERARRQTHAGARLAAEPDPDRPRLGGVAREVGADRPHAHGRPPPARQRLPRQPHLPAAEPDGQLGPTAADGNAAPVALQRQRDPRDVEEARGGQEPGLARRRKHPQAARASRCRLRPPAWTLGAARSFGSGGAPAGAGTKRRCTLSQSASMTSYVSESTLSLPLPQLTRSASPSAAVIASSPAPPPRPS